MSKFDSKKVMPRYSFLAILMTLVAITVVGKTLYIMTAKRAFWEEVADRVKVDSLKTLPIRGNILSCDGQLMASSLPQYNIFMDFVALREAKKDPRLKESGKLISFCFSGELFPLEPRTCFYNWLYLSALHQHPELTEPLMEYTAFTDIAFNPQKSINCQACAAAVYVSLRRNGLVEKALSDPQSFRDIVYGNRNGRPICER